MAAPTQGMGQSTFGVMPGESTVWSGTPYIAKRPIRGAAIGLGLLGFFFVIGGAFYLSFSFTAGIGTVLLVVGLLMWAGLAFLVLRRPHTDASYSLTSQRAIVNKVTRGITEVVQQCALAGTSTVVMNSRQEMVGRSYGRAGIYSAFQSQQMSTTRPVGDLIFMKGGANQVVFSNIPDPDGVKRMADQVIHSLG